MKKPVAILWLGFAALLIFSWVYLPTLSRYRDLKLQQDELERQIQKLTVDIEEIRQERDLLKNDKDYLEKVIRDEMGLVKPGEIVYKFVQEEALPPAPEPEVSPSPSASPAPVSSPSPAAVLEAKPVAPKTAVAAASIPMPRKSLPPPDAEPVYPRRETR